MGLFSRKKKENQQIVSYKFKNSKGFKGFKRINIVVHGIVEYPKTAPEVTDKEITINALRAEDGSPYCDVLLDGNRIGCLFQETAEAVGNGLIDAVHLEYREETVFDGKKSEVRVRPKMLVHYKEG